MGVFTDIDRTLGLAASVKLVKIRDKYRESGALDAEDFLYLINQTARYETIDKRLSQDSYKISKEYADLDFEISELMKDMMRELNHVRFSQLNEKKEYHFELSVVRMNQGSRASYYEWMNELEEGCNDIRRLQENFDSNGDAIKVIGTFYSLKRDYNLDVTITAETDKDELKQRVKALIAEKLQEENTLIQRRLKEFDVIS